MINNKYVPEINLTGYQIIDNNMFSKPDVPSMTLFPNAISFTQATYKLFNNCDCVKLYLNANGRNILITPTTSGEASAINWKSQPSKLGRINCTGFAKLLYDKWHLNPEKRYRTVGKVVQADQKIMILFTFTQPEIVDKITRTKKT